ncbi:hypothetical protein GLOTRDRAFT_117833 [Gloeophyllum trabeum ATCC 11539]|uniref:Cysteine-rich transmembrane CYSTM domain-containing protein n=1 Tax=Gloeophyllum trabeum (strain ATCC 11539 / FP-39264 / Madison 617) TaxID=670483 RepID=S7PWZ9_GLOTA|nr:uncharacterized protein GLOTRDRAFT_117833 [Gloeophyllum trabeum ATCC 11539]EPQ51907.1 hypothetical protein GLOTRDRAFT_117833 [Gloeophyllum trabeum ATCC 11539]
MYNGMSSEADGCFAAICGLCCVGLTGCCQAWCDTKRWGAGGCGGQRGCCGPCCSKSFDEDGFERAQREEAERRKRVQVDAQPAATPRMVQAQEGKTHT